MYTISALVYNTRACQSTGVQNEGTGDKLSLFCCALVMCNSCWKIYRVVHFRQLAVILNSQSDLSFGHQFQSLIFYEGASEKNVLGKRMAQNSIHTTILAKSLGTMLFIHNIPLSSLRLPSLIQY